MGWYVHGTVHTLLLTLLAVPVVVHALEPLVALTELQVDHTAAEDVIPACKTAGMMGGRGACMHTMQRAHKRYY